MCIIDQAYKASGLTAKDIDYFGLYDCFPICFIKALEGVGLAKANSGGRWINPYHNPFDYVYTVDICMHMFLCMHTDI